MFYVNFGEKSSEAFIDLDAKKVSINAATQKPNVIVMQQTLDNRQAK